MFGFLYEWIKNIAFYMVLATAVMQVLPDDSYKKYLRFFTGMVLILLLMTPVLSIFDMEESFHNLFTNAVYEQEVRKIKESTEYLNEIRWEDYVEEP